MVFTLAFGSASSALAARKVTKVVTGKIGASLRSSPEIMECNKLCGIHADVYLNVYGECNGWYYVNYNGQYGWVNASSQIVTVVATEEMPSAVIPGPYGSSSFIRRDPKCFHGKAICSASAITRSTGRNPSGRTTSCG